MNLAARLERVAVAGEVALSADTLADPAVGAVVAGRSELSKTERDLQLKGLTGTRRVVVLGRSGPAAVAAVALP